MKEGENMAIGEHWSRQGFFGGKSKPFYGERTIFTTEIEKSSSVSINWGSTTEDTRVETSDLYHLTFTVPETSDSFDDPEVYTYHDTTGKYVLTKAKTLLYLRDSYRIVLYIDKAGISEDIFMGMFKGSMPVQGVGGQTGYHTLVGGSVGGRSVTFTLGETYSLGIAFAQQEILQVLTNVEPQVYYYTHHFRMYANILPIIMTEATVDFDDSSTWDASSGTIEYLDIQLVPIETAENKDKSTYETEDGETLYFYTPSLATLLGAVTVAGEEYDSEIEGTEYEAGEDGTTTNDNDPGEGGGSGGGTNSYADGDKGFTDVSGFQTLQSTGLVSVYACSQANLISLANYLWSDNVIDQITKAVVLPGNILDYVLSCVRIPVSIPASKLDNVFVKMGPYYLKTTEGETETSLELPLIDSNWDTIDFGTLGTSETDYNMQARMTNTYLDFEPYTKYKLFLPFVGWVDISANHVTNTTLHLKLHIDYMTGDGVYELTCDSKEKQCIYSWSCNCSSGVPLSSDSSNLKSLSNIASAVGGVVGFAGAVSGNPVASRVTESFSAIGGATPTQTVTHSNSLTGNPGFLGIGDGKAHLLRIRKSVHLPSDWWSHMGLPHPCTALIGDQAGFLKCEDVDLNKVPDGILLPERDEIEQILLGGIYI